ncbi:MAG: FmdE family protein [Bacillota bacterium]|jgi:formylmethanofuran dehydrogenase subunit E
MRTFEEDLQVAMKYHGHLCSGQVIGVRMARYGLQHLEITSPEKYKDLIVYVEADRCIADAVCIATFCTMGRRRLKWVDYGKMAASFFDLATGKAVRISIKDSNKNPVDGEDIVTFWQKYTDDEIFKVQYVKINIPKEDLPGKPDQSFDCSRCGEKILDGRWVHHGSETICRACATTPYYEFL